MTIGIDISPACRVQKTGIEWYAWHVTRELFIQHGADHSFLLYTDTATDDFCDMKKKVLAWKSRYFWPEIRLSLEIAMHPPDVLFSPSRALPLVLPKRTVTTIHDVGFIPFPSERKKLSKEYLLMTSRRAAQRSDHILTVSEFSKNEIIKYFSIDPKKITVTYLGYDKDRYIPSHGRAVGRPYIVCTGRRERRKNIIGLIKGYELLVAQRGSDAPDLVFIGPPGHHSHEIDAALAQSPAHHSIRILNWLPEDEKIALLQYALVAVQPSLYEGFGLPVIEAQSCGIPIACSHAGSLPEVAGEGAVFFDPTNYESIAHALDRCIHETSLRQTLIEKGFENSKRFSWKECAENTYKTLANSTEI